MGRITTLKKLIIFIVILLVAYLLVQSNWLQRRLYPLRYREIVLQHAEEYQLDPYLVLAVIWVESKFDPKATSRRDARGLMQITIGTGQWSAQILAIEGYDNDSLYDPQINIRIGCWYLNNLCNQFDGELDVVLAAYNGGSGNVTEWLKDPRYSKDGKYLEYIPFKETREFVDRVWHAYKRYRQLYRI